MTVWDQGLLSMLRWNREQPTIEEEEISKGLCPFDNWPFKENEDGEKSCPICGRVFN